MADEKHARHLLAEMQARLARSAYDALNIPAGNVTPEQVRSAFHQLAKHYHPAKFARMSPEIQKIANEVFLALRAAHDQLSRPKVRPSQPYLPAKTPPPELRPNSPPAPSTALDPATQRGVQPASAVAPRPATTASIPVSRTTTPVVATPVRRGLQHPATVRRATPPGGVPATGPRPAVPATRPAPAKVEPELVGVFADLERGAWSNARAALTALLAMRPESTRYQALLHYANGREALAENRMGDARYDLNMAARLAPELEIVKAAVAELFRRK